MKTYIFDIHHVDQTNGERVVTRIEVDALPGDRIAANKQAWTEASIIHGISLGSILHAQLVVDPTREDA